jgi:hypothetical protein
MPAARWLSSKPKGEWQVLIGGQSDRLSTVNRLVEVLKADRRSLLTWWVKAFQEKRIDIRVTAELPALPEGIELPD